MQMGVDLYTRMRPNANFVITFATKTTITVSNKAATTYLLLLCLRPQCAPVACVGRHSARRHSEGSVGMPNRLQASGEQGMT